MYPIWLLSSNLFLMSWSIKNNVWFPKACPSRQHFYWTHIDRVRVNTWYLRHSKQEMPKKLDNLWNYSYAQLRSPTLNLTFSPSFTSLFRCLWSKIRIGQRIICSILIFPIKIFRGYTLITDIYRGFKAYFRAFNYDRFNKFLCSIFHFSLKGIFFS